MSAAKRLIAAAKEMREVSARRFGPNHEKPCKKPTTITCALWKCQEKNKCQWKQP